MDGAWVVMMRSYWLSDDRVLTLRIVLPGQRECWAPHITFCLSSVMGIFCSLFEPTAVSPAICFIRFRFFSLL